MKKMVGILLTMLLLSTPAFAKHESNDQMVAPVSAYGTYNGNVVPMKVSSDGTLATSGGGSGSGTVDQGTGGSSAWLVTGTGGTFPVTGTFYQATQPVSIASMPSTPVTGTFWQATQPVSATHLDIRHLNSTDDAVSVQQFPPPASIADNTNTPSPSQITSFPMMYDGATWDMLRGDSTNGLLVNSVVLGAKADAKSTATDTTAITAMSVLKQISYMEQNPASRAVTNAGAFPVDLNPPTSLGTNQKNVTTAGSREALAGSTPCLSVTIKAKKTNGGLIYVGTAAGVSSTTGFILSPGEVVTVDTNNLANVGLDSSVNGEGVSYIYAVK